MVREQDNSVCKNFINLVIILATIVGLSFGSYTFCTWYGCVNAAYHLNNFQIVLYGSMLSLITYNSLITYKMTSLVNKASSPTATFIFEDYSLGRNSPRRLNVKKN